MSKTITVSDAFWNELVTLVNGGPVIVPPPVVVPPATPPGVKVIELPWASTIGRAVARIPAGGSLAFRFTVPVGYDSKGGKCNFSQSPTGGDDYFFRNLTISDKPGDFTGSGITPEAFATMQGANQDSRIQFAVGTQVMRGILVKRPDLTVPMLTAGKTYYFNVRQIDPNLSCNIDYSLRIV